MKINDLCQGKAIIENILTFLNQHDNKLWYSVFERFQAKKTVKQKVFYQTTKKLSLVSSTETQLAHS